MALRRVQSFVTAAGEALGLTEDPLQTVIGMKVSVDDKKIILLSYLLILD